MGANFRPILAIVVQPGGMAESVLKKLIVMPALFSQSQHLKLAPFSKISIEDLTMRISSKNRPIVIALPPTDDLNFEASTPHFLIVVLSKTLIK